MEDTWGEKKEIEGEQEDIESMRWWPCEQERERSKRWRGEREEEEVGAREVRG